METPHRRDRNGEPRSARVSLVTVTYNSAATLAHCWREFAPTAEVEWIVVDNASTDGTAEVARGLGATVIELEENRGFSYANNVGWRAASGSVIGFINPDVTVRLGDIDEVYDIAESDGGLFAPQLMNADGSAQPNARGIPLLRWKIFNRLGRENPRYNLSPASDEPFAAWWVMGAAIFGSRRIVETIDGWDSHFFLYYEDKDICLRAWEAGFSVTVYPKLRWYHGWARETKKFSLAPWRRELSSMWKFYRRYPEYLLGKKVAYRVHPSIADAVYGDH